MRVDVTQVQAGGPPGGFAFPLDVAVKAGATSTRVVIDVAAKAASKAIPFEGTGPISIDVDPDEWLFGVFACGPGVRVDRDTRARAAQTATCVTSLTEQRTADRDISSLMVRAPQAAPCARTHGGRSVSLQRLI